MKLIDYNIILHPTVHVQVQLLHPRSRLQWKRCADMPVKTTTAHAVVVGDEVYVGGGGNDDQTDPFVVLKYDTVKDEWTRLPDHCLAMFGLCQFQGELVALGGMSLAGVISNEVYRYSTANKKWVESLKPMQTKRMSPALLTTLSAIIVCGGASEENHKWVRLSTVEVYSSTTSQWHTADPIPQPCAPMSSLVISGCGFLLGGVNASNQPNRLPFSVDLATLVERATSVTRRRSTTSDWKTLPDIPFPASIAATLSGGLLAVGGSNDKNQVQSSVHLFIPSTNSWVKLPSGDKPVEKCRLTTANLLSNNRVMVIGGKDNRGRDTSTCYIGSVVI